MTKSTQIKVTVICGTLLLALTAVTACGTGSTIHTKSSAGVADKRAAAAFPVTLTDDAKQKVTVQKQPMRIASTTEGTDEILAGLVPKNRIVMVTSYATDPTYSNVASKLKGIPKIQAGKASAEAIVAQKPDLVMLASYTSPGVVSQIRQAGIPSYEFNDFNSIADIEKNIKVVGKLVGEEAKASQLDAQMQRDLNGIQHAVQGQKKVTVLDYSSYGFAAGKNTTVNDVIVGAGGVNAAASLNGWQKITDEQIVKMNPNVIIDASNDGNFIQKIMHNPALQDVSAVKQHRVYGLEASHLTAVSQYVVDGVHDLAQKLYPTAKLPQENIGN